jgi:lysophospholipase L1-like esterase
MPRQNSLRRPVRVAGWLPRPSSFALLAALVLVAACSSPTAPTPPEPPPPPPPPVVVDPPSITCPPSVGDTATSDAGGSIIFGAPQVDKGAAPVTLACTHSSGSSFPIGVTTVECTASDAMNRSATCSFQVTVTPSPKIALTKFMAFGDSITAGEVTSPIGSSFGTFLFTKQVVVPSASYPTALQRQLASRYLAQASSIQVVNEGQPGETAPEALPRFLSAINRVRPEAVLLLEGYNGVTANGGASGAAAAVSTMASEARNRGMRVFIATLTPAKPGSRAIPDLFLLNYNDRMRNIARGEGAPLVDLFAALSTDVNAYIGIDGLHPNEAGYRKMAETFFAAIRAELER